MWRIPEINWVGFKTWEPALIATGIGGKAYRQAGKRTLVDEVRSGSVTFPKMI